MEEDIRKEWREEVIKWPQMDALGSADWWIEKIRKVEREAHERDMELAIGWRSIKEGNEHEKAHNNACNSIAESGSCSVRVGVQG